MDDIISELRDCVAHEGPRLHTLSSDDLRRESTTQVLENVGSFLISWEGLAGDDDEFPSGVVRDALSLLLSELGPDAQIRMAILELLPALNRADSRQLLLDVLPWTMPVDKDEMESEARTALKVLRGVLLDDSTALLPVLGCLSSLSPLLPEADRKEARELAVKSLPVVSEADLPVLVKALFRHVSDADGARNTLNAIREELSMVEAASDDIHSVALVSDVLLCAFQHQTTGDLIPSAYLQIFRETASKKLEELDMEASGLEKVPEKRQGVSEGFLLFDLAAILGVYEHPMLKGDLETVLDSLLQSHSFPFDPLKKFMKTLCHRNGPGRPSSVLYDRLAPSLLSLGISLLLTPVRNCTLRHLPALMDNTHDFIVELHLSMDQERQEDLIYCLLHLSEETSVLPQKKRRTGRSRLSHTQVEENEAKFHGLSMTFFAVHRVLRVLAVANRSAVARFKHVLIGRLTATDSRADTNGAYTSIYQLCQILGSLVEPVHSDSGCGAGIDPSELMMLLQKLLFSSACRQRESNAETDVRDNDRVVRGLLLATELVRSPYCAQADKDCIQQWVLRILLPSNDRALDPELGPYGLRFLAAWSKWEKDFRSNHGFQGALNFETCDGVIFKHVKGILARTGLVQIRSQYQQRRKRNDDYSVLGYTELPQCCKPENNHTAGASLGGDSNQNIPRRRKTRRMVFCTTSFLRASGMPHPSRWAQSVTWIFHLVDKYLTLGRKQGTNGAGTEESSPKKAQWVPDGWLQAAIELPVVRISIENRSGKKRNYKDYVSGVLAEYEVSHKGRFWGDIHHSDFSCALVRGKTLMEVQEEVDAIFRLSLVMLHSLALSFAVLENAYRHFSDEDLSACHASDGSHELFLLIRFQLMKMYDLRGKCLFCSFLLKRYKASIPRFEKSGGVTYRSENTTSRQTEEHISGDNKGKRIGGPDVESLGTRKGLSLGQVEGAKVQMVSNKLVTDIDQVVEQTNGLLSGLFSSAFCSPTVLWQSMMDTKDDEILKNLPFSETETTDLSSARRDTTQLNHVVALRRHVINHLVMIVREQRIAVQKMGAHFITEQPTCLPKHAPRTPFADLSTCQENSGLTALVYKSAFGHAVSMASYFSQSEKGHVLFAPYITLVHSIIVYVTKHQGTNCDSRGSLSFNRDVPESSLRTPQLSDLIQIWENRLKMTGPSNGNGSSTALPGSLSKVYHAVLSNLNKCEDCNAALALVDLLSVLSLRGNQDLIDSTLEATNSVLFTVYSSNLNEESWNVEWPECSCLPYVFLEAVQVVLGRSGRKGIASRRTTTVAKAMQKTILKSANSSSREHKQHIWMRNSLFGLWGLMVFSPRSWRQSLAYITKLSDALEALLDDIGRKSTKRPASRVSTGADGVTGRTTNGSKQPFVSTVPSLTYSSMPVYFEYILHMSVSLFAVSSINEKQSVQTVPGEQNPYKSLENAIESVSLLIDLYTTKFKAFPRCTTSVVLGACSVLLNLTMHHVDLCVHWRNAQPLLSLEEKRAGIHDHGSIVHLESLLDSFASNGAGKVLHLCEFIRKQAAQSRRDTARDSDTEPLDMHGESWVFVSHHRRITSLALAAEDALGALRDVAYAHNLFAPNIRSTKSESNRKRSFADVDNGLYQSESLSVLDPNKVETRRRKRRIAPLSVSQQSDQIDVSNDSSVDRRSDHQRDSLKTMRPENNNVLSATVMLMQEADSGSSASFGIDGEWDQSDEGSSGSLELESQA